MAVPQFIRIILGQTQFLSGHICSRNVHNCFCPCVVQLKTELVLSHDIKW